MSLTPALKSPWVRGFIGEDSNHLPSMLPPNMAQDARNTDYYRGTVLKRSGFIRLDDRPMMGGGVWFRQDATTFNSTNANGVITWSPSASFAVSMVVQMEKAACSGTSKIYRHGTTIGATGLTIYYDPANDRFYAEIESSGGTKTLAQANGSYTNDTIVGLMLIYYVADNGTKYYRFYQDATLVEASHAADTYTAPAGNISRWAYDAATAQTCKFRLDEVRMWDLASANDSAYTTWLEHWTTDLGYRRELTTAEMALSTLTKCYRFNLSEFVFGTGFSPTDGSGAFVIPVPAFGLATRSRDRGVGRGLVNAHYDSDWPRSTAVALWPSDFGELWAQFGAEIYLHVNHTAVGRAVYASRVSETHVYGSGVPTLEAWSVARYRTRLVAVHPSIGCYHIGLPSGTPTYFRTLVPPAPSIASITADDSGAGSGPGAGTYLFRFYFRNSVTGVHSPGSASISVTMAGANAIEFNNTGIFDIDAQRYLDGVDTIDVFRTKAGGATFYLVESITLPGAPADPYTSASMNVTDANIAETNSEINLRYYLAVRQPYRARAVFEHRGLLVLVAPDESGRYNEAADYRETFHNAIMWSDPLAIHLFATDNFKEVLPDVIDYCVGGISVVGGALIAKRYSLVGAFGENLGQASYRHISHTIGCLAHNTISASDEFVYLLSDKGIARVPVSLQPGSVRLVQQDRFKPLYDDIDPTRVGMACGIYYSKKRQYWCSFDTVNNGRVTLVYSEESDAVARYDHEIEAFCEYQANDPAVADTALIGSWRGYLVELDSGETDGSLINATTVPLTGTVTSADAQSLTDSGQAWATTGLYGLITAQDPYARLAGLKIKVTKADGSDTQTNTIYFNSATRLWVETPWDWTPSAGDTFAIAGIDWYWRSARLCPHGDPGEKEHGLRLGFLQTKQSSSDDIALDVYIDGDTALSDERTLVTNVRHKEFLVNNRSREVYFQLSNDQANAPFELEAYQAYFQQAAIRTANVQAGGG